MLDREFFRLDSSTQQEIRMHLAVCERIAANPAGVIAAAHQESKLFHGLRGMSAKRIIARYYEYKNTGNWRMFARDKDLRTLSTHLPVEFIDYWHGLVLQNKRKTRAAHRRLLEIWRDENNSIPGYGNWREWWGKRLGHAIDTAHCPPDLPHGWSYETLNKLKPSEAELSLARYGVAATRKLLPHVIGTREGMRPLEYLVYDDVELDFLVVVPGVERPCKLRALVVKDVATDCWLRFVLRPALVREDGTQDGLKLRDMKRLCLEELMNFGFPTDYVSHWIMERGTATLPEADILALAELSGCMIQVHLTSMISGKVLMGGYADKSVGNSWGKAWIESGFNPLHNELALLPGQKGRRYDLAPAELETRKKAATDLMRAGKALPPDLRLLLRLPFVDIFEAHKQIEAAMMRINLVEDHNCEGFEKIVKWRLDDGDQWKPHARLLELPPEMMDRVITKSFVETRMERWARLAQGLKFEKMSEEFAPRWLDDHRKVRVENYQIKFVVDSKTHVYFHRDSPLLVEGSEYLAYYNPFDMAHIYLTNAEGGYRGKLPRVRAVHRGDQEALAKRMADVKHVLNTHIASARAKTRGAAEQAISDMEHNIALFQDTPSTPLLHLNQAVAETKSVRELAAARREATEKMDEGQLLDSVDSAPWESEAPAEPESSELPDPTALL